VAVLREQLLALLALLVLVVLVLAPMVLAVLRLLVVVMAVLLLHLPYLALKCAVSPVLVVPYMRASRQSVSVESPIVSVLPVTRYSR
jgi:hypothetical protein